MKLLENFSELEEYDAGIAEELLENYEEGSWQDDTLYVYDNAEELAHYELTEGWYAERFADADYNGAPDPMGFIDLELLGDSLISTWDESVYHLLNDGRIVYTPYGW